MAPKMVSERTAGLPCPACGDVRSRVLETRVEQVGTHTATRRRRACTACGHIYATYELIEALAAPLLKRGLSGEYQRALVTLRKIRRVLAAYDRREPEEGTGAEPGA